MRVLGGGALTPANRSPSASSPTTRRPTARLPGGAGAWIPAATRSLVWTASRDGQPGRARSHAPNPRSRAWSWEKPGFAQRHERGGATRAPFVLSLKPTPAPARLRDPLLEARGLPGCGWRRRGRLVRPGRSDAAACTSPGPGATSTALGEPDRGQYSRRRVFGATAPPPVPPRGPGTSQSREKSSTPASTPPRGRRALLPSARARMGGAL